MPEIYKRLLIVVVGGILAFVLHVGIGWAWTSAAGLAVGVTADRGGWWYGGLAVFSDWLVLVGWNFAVAAGPTARMVSSMGELMGNMPGGVFVGVTLFTGFGLGAVGGLVGQQLRRLGRDLYGLSTSKA